MPLRKYLTIAKSSAFAALYIAAVNWAHAAEYSTPNSLGFTLDGNHFVFEEYGTTDGIGAAYVNLYAIDIVGDGWIKGTPVRLKATEEDTIALEEKLAKEGITDPHRIDVQFRKTVDDMRLRALEMAAPVLAPLGELAAADLRAHNPPNEFTSDARHVRFAPVGFRTLINSDTSQQVWRLDVAEKTFPASKDCFELYESMKGFSLTLTNESSGQKTVLNQDNRVPKSRGCPQKYYVEQVLTFPRANGAYSLAVLIRYSLPGFEGPDGRLLAVTAVVDAAN